MIVEMAAIFGMSIDDLVKLIAAFTAATSTLLTAATTMLIKLRGARKRVFLKVRRIEDLVELFSQAQPDATKIDKLIMEMKADQRAESDKKDGYDE